MEGGIGEGRFWAPLAMAVATWGRGIRERRCGRRRRGAPRRGGMVFSGGIAGSTLLAPGGSGFASPIGGFGVEGFAACEAGAEEGA